MASYLVLTPPDDPDAAADAVIIRDGFAFWALPLPALWLLVHRLWFAGGLLLLVSVGLVFAVDAFPQWTAVFVVALVLLSIYVALEGNGLRIARHERQDWTVDSIIEAPNAATAEAIYLSGFPQTERPKAPRPPGRGWVVGHQPGKPPPDAGPALGLLDPQGKN